MINWNKELVKTILVEIKDKNRVTSNYIEDIYSSRADSIDRAIGSADWRATDLTEYVDAILGHLSEENYDDLKELLDI